MGDDQMQAMRKCLNLISAEVELGSSEALIRINDFEFTLRYHTPESAIFDCQSVSQFPENIVKY